jgi:hypothetical protein
MAGEHDLPFSPPTVSSGVQQRCQWKEEAGAKHKERQKQDKQEEKAQQPSRQDGQQQQ